MQIFSCWILVIFQPHPQTRRCVCSILPQFKKFYCIRNWICMFLQFMNSHFHFLFIVELATFQVLLLQWPIRYDGWCTTSQWNNCYISWFWHVVFGVALLCWRITPCNRLFLWATGTTHGEVADSTVMREWKWLFVNGSEWKSPIWQNF